MAEGKWIGDLSATMPLAEAARQVLGVRFQVVRTQLPLVLHEADKDPEHVHQLRVATRRADAALRIFRGVLPHRVYKHERARLRFVRRAAGAARDWDVFQEELGARCKQAPEKELAGLDYLSGYARGQRDAAQPELTAAVVKCEEDFDEKHAQLLAAVRVPNDCSEAAVLVDLARPLLTTLHQTLEAHIATDLTDYHNLHQARIQGKRLRYAMEIFAGCFAEAFRSELYPQIEEMQDLLGRANDSHVAGQRLAPLRTQVRREADLWKRLQAGLNGLWRYHQRRLPQERRKFLVWWENWSATGGPRLMAMIAGG